MSPEKIVRIAKRRGLDAVAIADHNSVFSSSEAKKHGDITIIPAAEYSSDVGHILALFADRHVSEYGAITQNGAYSYREVIDIVHSQGGVCILAHPFERENPPPSLCAEFDGIEVANSRAAYSKKGRANELAASSVSPGQYITAGSDAHLPREIGRSFVAFDAEDSSKEAILSALLSPSVFSSPTSPAASAQSQIYKSLSQKNPLRPKSFAKLAIGAMIAVFPKLFGITPYRRKD